MSFLVESRSSPVLPPLSPCTQIQNKFVAKGLMVPMEELLQKVSSLAGCVDRLKSFASPKLLTALTEGQQMITDVKNQAARIDQISSIARIFEGGELEKEIVACSLKLAKALPLSHRSAEEVANPDLLTTIDELICEAVRKGSAVRFGHSLNPDVPDKMSCHFVKEPFPKVDVREIFVDGGKKQIFKLIHLNDGVPSPVEGYAKVKKAFQKVPKLYDSFLSLLRKDADMSILLRQPEKTDGAVSGPAVDRGKEYILRSTKRFHRKNPMVFKGVLMDFCDQKDLWTLSRPPITTQERKERLTLAFQLAIALESMHNRHICHLDMKGGNAFLKSGAQGPSVRLGDFEFSTIEGLKIRPNIGTRSYLPPEVLTTKEWEVAPSGDMWGLGLTLLELMHGEDANFFLTDLSDEIFSKPNKVVFAKWKEIHTKIINNLNLQDPVDGLIARLLAIDPPSSRPSATEVVLKLEEVLTKEGPVVRLGI